MTAPTPPGDPQSGWQQPAQPPSYGNAPASPGGPAAGRPSQVTTAAALGFVAAAFLLLGALGLFALSSVLGILVLFAVLYLVLAAGTIYGGVVAIQGKGSSVLGYAGIALAVLAVIGIIVQLTQGTFDVTSLISVAMGVGIVLLLRQPASQQWFASRGVK